MDGASLRRLMDAIAAGFDAASFEHFLRFEMGHNFEHLSSSQKPFPERVFDALLALEKQDQIEKLLGALVQAEQSSSLTATAQALLDGVRTSTGGEPASSPPPMPPAPSLFGRDELLEELVTHLISRDPAPTPILGGPGMGKTALSIHALRSKRVVERFGQRRYFLSCQGLESAEALPGAIGLAMGQTLGGDPRLTVLKALSASPVLLVLDNFETPWEKDMGAAEALLSELAECPKVSLVVSVRGGERPNGRWRPTVEVGRLSLEASRELFLSVTDGKHGSDPDLQELLEILDGVALANRLMANASASLPSIRHAIDQWRKRRAEILSRGAGKDENLGFSISLSLAGERLDAKGRRLASILSLLPAGTATDDLDSLLPDDGVEGARQLAASGLASYVDDRIEMLSPVREAILQRQPPSEPDRDHVARFFLGLLEKGKHVGGPGGAEAVARLEPELANLDSALRRLVQIKDLDSLLRARYGYAELCRFRGVGTLELLEDIARLAAAGERPTDQADCIRILGDIALARSDHEVARESYESALPLFRQVGSVLGEANCIVGLGDIALRRSDHEVARERYASALPLYRQVGSVQGEANCIWSLGDIALRRSDHEVARERYESALPLYHQGGDVQGEANCILGLGEIALCRSDHEVARERIKSALPLYRQVGSVQGEANCIRSLGEIALRRSDHEVARERFKSALPLYRQAGSVLGEANCILGLGEIALHRSDHEVARERCESALPLYHQVGSVLGEANCIWSLGEIALCHSDHEVARERYESALPLYRQVGDVEGEANCFRSLGVLAEKESEPSQARQQWGQALKLYRRIPEPHSIGETLVRLARLEEPGPAQQELVALAREQWSGLDRPELLEELDAEFGDY